MANSLKNGKNDFLCQSSCITLLQKKSGVHDMGRGHGGYVEKHESYRDSGGHKVTDPGTIFVAELYMDEGYEVVFRQQHQPDRMYDLSIKSSNDEDFIKNIEVKRVTSSSPSKIADRIKSANKQISDGGTIAIVLPYHKNNETGRAFAEAGIAEARRKGLIKGPVEVWFSDKTKIAYE